MERQASRVALPIAAATLGFLAVVAATAPRTAPARDTRRLEVVDLISVQDERVRELQDEVRGLEQRIAGLGQGSALGDESVRDLRAEAQRLAAYSGGAALEGPGVTVVLDDSSSSRSPTGDPNDLVVHEQDIQTVVNALWAAGAEAVAINGQRLSSISAVRCAGNTLLLHGVVHSPPYEIGAIGDPAALAASLPAQPGIERLLEAVEAFGLGYEVKVGSVRIPPGTLTPTLSRAFPAT